MKTLTYTLIADGPSDRCLIPIINWLLANLPFSSGELFIDPQFADYRESPDPPSGLGERMQRAVRDFPCDVLFVHRDAEREPPQNRRIEITSAAEHANVGPVVCVVPVRMTEAWLLFDQKAIRRASGNPNGDATLRLPSLRRVEHEPDPKSILREALETASEASGRRLKQFQRDISSLVPRVAELIEDFSPLRELTGFQAFESEVLELFSTLNLRNQ